MSRRFTFVRVVLALLLVLAFSLTATHSTIQRSSRFSVMGRFTTGQALAVSGYINNATDGFAYQGYLTDDAGHPLTGSYDMTFRLYSTSYVLIPSPHTAYTFEAANVLPDVQVTNGLFTAVLYGLGHVFTGEHELVMGIQVGTDPEMTPYQYIASAPMALGLYPGTVIKNTDTAANEPGLEVHSQGSGTTGAAVIATSDRYTTAGGTGLYAESQGTDATIVTKNNGGGLLLEGYGSDGGGDEFRITNQGAIQTKQDSYIFVPAGAVLAKYLSTDTTRWNVNYGGNVVIYSGFPAGGTRSVVLPLSVATILYGQPVELKSITVHYMSANGSNAYITSTYLWASTKPNVSTAIGYDPTDRTSMTATSYALSPDSPYTLSPSKGLAVSLTLKFADDTSWLAISGISVQLGHHPDY